MKSHTRFLGLAAVAAMLFMAGGCEQTAVVAPAEGSLSLQASPQTVVIDTDQGEDFDTALIIVQVLDRSNIPQADVSVLLTTSGGALAGSTNICGTTGSCTLSADGCVDDDDCPEVVPAPLETNGAGIATDTLRLSISDPNTITLSAISGSLAETLEVEKVVSDGNQPPDVRIGAFPSTEGNVNEDVFFDAFDFTDPEGDELTCYLWEVVSDSGTDCRGGVNVDDIRVSFATEQTVNVTVRVSDVPPSDADFNCPVVKETDPCPDQNELDVFNAQDQLFGYAVCGTHVEPLATIVVVSPTSTTQQLPGGGGSVTWELDGSTSTDDTGIQSYSWNCGTGGTLVGSGENVFCSYTTEGAREVSLTVSEVLAANEITQCREQDSTGRVLTVTSAP